MSKVDNHNGNPQDEYNMIQNSYPHMHLIEEANYVLEEDAEQANVFAVTKKPEGEVAESVSDVQGFIEDKEKVLIKRADGSFSRFNFEDDFKVADAAEEVEDETTEGAEDAGEGTDEETPADPADGE